MAIFSNEKVQIALALTNMVFLGAIWFSEQHSKSAVENTSQTQQIVALNQKVDQIFAFLDKRLDRIETKIDNKGGRI